MNVYINNQQHVVVEGLSVNSLLDQLGLNVKGLAIAVNNNIIPRQSWSKYSLAENDEITIIRATQGG